MISNFPVSTVPVDGLASSGARPSAATVMTKFRIGTYRDKAVTLTTFPTFPLITPTSHPTLRNPRRLRSWGAGVGFVQGIIKGSILGHGSRLSDSWTLIFILINKWGIKNEQPGRTTTAPDEIDSSQLLTLLVLRLKWYGETRSILWLLIPWLLVVLNP